MINVQPNGVAPPLLQGRMGRRRRSGDAKAKSGADFDDSSRTAEADISEHSPEPSPSRTDAALGGGCLKVRTQRDSLARSASAPVLPSVPERNRVRFGAVEFREYRRILSDNPSTTAGPPIGIGWRHDPEETVSLEVDLYESEREGCRRSKAELSMPPFVREELLREAGYSRNEIRTAVKAAKKEREQRRASNKHQKLDPLFERAEAARSGVRRLLSRRRSTTDLSQ